MARAFAREGATVFLAGRDRCKLDHVAQQISAAGGTTDIAEVDALDEEVFAGMAAPAGVSVESMLAERARSATLLKRLPTLTEVADVAAFVASDSASAMTGAIVNLSCGSLVTACSSAVRRRSGPTARRFATAMSQAPGLSGTPDSGHCSSAATSASCA